jgi:hypothetical protein
LTFPNTTNGLGKSSQAYNEGDLKSANIVQAEDRTRVVLNLQKAMTYEATIDGNSLLLALVPSSATPAGTAPVEHFAQAYVLCHCPTAFATSPSGAARMVRDGSRLTSPTPMPASTSSSRGRIWWSILPR